MSLAIACQMLKFAWLPEYRPNETPGPGTMGFIERKLYGDQFTLGRPAGRMVRTRRRIGGQSTRSA